MSSEGGSGYTGFLIPTGEELSGEGVEDAGGVAGLGEPDVAGDEAGFGLPILFGVIFVLGDTALSEPIGKFLFIGKLEELKVPVFVLIKLFWIPTEWFSPPVFPFKFIPELPL